jgi:dolichol kinase
MKNLKTTIAGSVAAICAALATQFPQYGQILVAVGTLSAALFAFFCQDATPTPKA